MPLKTAAKELSAKDSEWLKGLTEEGIGIWQTGNRPLTDDEFARLMTLIREHDLPCTSGLDIHDGYNITVHVPTSDPGKEPEPILSLSAENFPGFKLGAPGWLASRGPARMSLARIVDNPKNRELVALYGLLCI